MFKHVYMQLCILNLRFKLFNRHSRFRFAQVKRHRIDGTRRLTAHSHLPLCKLVRRPAVLIYVSHVTYAFSFQNKMCQEAKMGRFVCGNGHILSRCRACDLQGSSPKSTGSGSPSRATSSAPATATARCPSGKRPTPVSHFL